jgi:hypothetical protein
MDPLAIGDLTSLSRHAGMQGTSENVFILRASENGGV